MKAYAVLFADCYYLIFADSADEAKGMVIERQSVLTLSTWFSSLRCRRWPELDGLTSMPRFNKWGVPGLRDSETGSYIDTPTPFDT